MKKNSSNIEQAVILEQKAHKCLYPNVWNAIFKNSDERYDKAFEYIKEASNLYIIDRQYLKAGDCIVQCAQIKQQQKENYLYLYEEAFICYNKDKATDKSNEMLRKLIEGNVSMGKFRQAAEYQVTIAESYAAANQYKEACNAYDIAAEYYNMDKDSSSTCITEINIKRADLMCLYNDADAKEQARYLYDQSAKDYLHSRFGKHSAKDLYTKCVICYLVYDDYLSARAFLHKFYNEDASYEGDSYAEFLEILIEIMSSENYIEFSKAIKDYKKSKKRWDKWMEVMMKKLEDQIKDKIKEEANFAAEDDDFR